MVNPRPASLSSTRDIRQFFHKARRVLHHEAIDIKLAPATQEFGRFLLSVPRKMGSAPERNKFKRRVRAIFYEQSLHKQGFDWGFFAKPAANKLSFAELQALITSCHSKKICSPEPVLPAS